MGYENKKQTYVIENDVDEMDIPKVEKKMKTATLKNGQLPDNYEIQEDDFNKAEQISNEILETAREEGLESSEEYLGGENATPQEVIDAMMNEKMPEGAEKNKEEYEEKKVKKFRKVVATRDLLYNRLKRTVPCSIQTVLEIENEYGELEAEPVELEFEVRRLTESENTHLYNHKLFGKDIAELTDEEYSQSVKFRSELLSRAVVGELKMTAEQWRTEVDFGLLNAIYDEVNRVLTDADDATLFR